MWEEIKNTKTPCKNCTMRHEGCHSKCDLYKAFKEDLDSKQEALKQWKRETYFQRMDDPDIKKLKEKKRK